MIRFALASFTLAACAAALAACGPAADNDAIPPPAPHVPAPPPPPPEYPLEVGSKDAQDDLYCSALIFAATPVPSSAMSPTDEARMVKVHSLALIIGDSGMNRLVAERAAHATHAGVIGDAYADRAAADYDAGTPRISVDECIARAEAVPPFE